MKAILLLVTVIGFVLPGCRNKTQQVTEKDSPNKVYSTDSLNINYTINGVGDTTLLFVHGWGIDLSYWNDQVKEFSPRYKVVTIDLPGFGASGKGRDRYTIERYADDVAEVIRHLALNRVILVGHSMSGEVILETMLRHPENIAGLVGIDNFQQVGYNISEKERNEINAFLQSLKNGYQQTAGAYAEQSLFHKDTDTAVRKRVIKEIQLADSIVAISALEELFKYQDRLDSQLQKLPVKLNLVNSDATPVDTAALARYCGSGYQVFYVHATGHYPMVEKPAEFNAALQQAIYSLRQHDGKTSR